MKDENCQAEPIVIGSSRYIAQLERLQLRWREVGRADWAIERAVTRTDLERIAIDHPHAHTFVNQQVALVDVAHHDIRRVKRLKRGGRVSGGEYHVMPAGFWKVLSTVRGAIQLVKLPGAVHLCHQKA